MHSGGIIIKDNVYRVLESDGGYVLYWGSENPPWTVRLEHKNEIIDIFYEQGHYINFQRI